MYYSESERLTEQQPESRASIHVLDRELAHAYHPQGYGRVTYARLRARTQLTPEHLDPLLNAYIKAGEVDLLDQWACECGENHDPDEAECADCGAPQSGEDAGLRVVRVIRRPSEPAFDPDRQPTNPDVFVSYRRQDTSVLATDLYYALTGHEYSVFLDRGEIAVGAEPARTYLRAASNSRTFIALVSENYFESGICKLELAHAARAGSRLVRVNVPPLPNIPADIAWINIPNWHSVEGSPAGLSRELEESLLAVIRTPPRAGVADLRRDACRYLMEQRTPSQLEQLRGRLPWMREYSFMGMSKPQIINTINAETSDVDLPRLCDVLAPD
ncbi:MAG: toll/interleukin-1 receptor domain-containing protein [Gemmatimonadetes bacterium]|nr:toll/interleukin-1 receptor domain-containing protein [Gemmatimonadota bacterium]